MMPVDSAAEGLQQQKRRADYCATFASSYQTLCAKLPIA
jgi:hypothetical protein